MPKCKRQQKQCNAKEFLKDYDPNAGVCVWFFPPDQLNKVSKLWTLSWATLCVCFCILLFQFTDFKQEEFALHSDVRSTNREKSFLKKRRKKILSISPTVSSVWCFRGCASSHNMHANFLHSSSPQLFISRAPTQFTMKGDPAEHRRFQIYEPLAQDEGPAMKRLSRGFRLRARVLADLRQLFRLHCPLEETSALCCSTVRLQKIVSPWFMVLIFAWLWSQMRISVVTMRSHQSLDRWRNH